MNKTVIGAIAAVVVVAGAGWYFFSGAGGSIGSMMNSNEPQQQMSMKELIAMNISQKCDFSEPQSKTAGTIYIADGKVRGDFTSETEAGTMSGHMIADGTTVNTWMDGMNQGFKASFEMSGTTGGGDTQQGLDPSKKTDYKCEKWSKDESKFLLPSGITFTDMSAMMQGGAKAGVGAGPNGMPTKSAQCNMCDQAPEPQRTQCREALSCR